MARSRYGGTTSAPSIVVDEVLTLDDVYTLPNPSARNRTTHADKMDPDYGGDTPRGTGFYGGVARKDVQSFAGTYTMPDSARRLYETLTQDLPALSKKNKRRQRHNRETGDVISDFGHYETFRAGLTTDTAFWSDSYRVERKHRGVISLGLNCAINAGGEQSDYEYRAATAVALTDYLEALGYRVELWALVGNNLDYSNPAWWHNMAVRVKDANGSVSENGLAFASHLGVFRHCWFNRLASKEHQVPGGYGRATNYTGSVKVDIEVPYVRYGYGLGDFTQAKAWLDETLARLAEDGGEE